MKTRRNFEGYKTTWIEPEDFTDLTPQEQMGVVQACILKCKQKDQIIIRGEVTAEFQELLRIGPKEFRQLVQQNIQLFPLDKRLIKEVNE